MSRPANSRGLLRLVGTPRPGPDPAEVEAWLDVVTKTELGEFALYLNKARWILHNAKELLFAPELPEEFNTALSTYRGTAGNHPEVREVAEWKPGMAPPFCFLHDPTECDLREKLRPFAVEACTPSGTNRSEGAEEHPAVALL